MERPIDVYLARIDKCDTYGDLDRETKALLRDLPKLLCRYTRKRQAIAIVRGTRRRKSSYADNLNGEVVRRMYKAIFRIHARLTLRKIENGILRQILPPVRVKD